MDEGASQKICCVQSWPPQSGKGAGRPQVSTLRSHGSLSSDVLASLNVCGQLQSDGALCDRNGPGMFHWVCQLNVEQLRLVIKTLETNYR